MNILNVMSEWDYTNERVLFWMDLNRDVEWIVYFELILNFVYMLLICIFIFKFQVVLETEITNKPALKLYENLGFVRDKRLFRYYLNGVDALRLKLWLR
ncbi:UNVERIFIED_CONTAM: N-alpha-acetyltransferase 30 [Trichonephila clavipes]